jgi:hypothetical protein
MSKVLKALGWCTRALHNWQLISHNKTLCRVQWAMYALRSKETFDNVKLTDETSVEMGADGTLFSTRKIHIWISAS